MTFYDAIYIDGGSLKVKMEFLKKILFATIISIGIAPSVIYANTIPPEVFINAVQKNISGMESVRVI